MAQGPSKLSEIMSGIQDWAGKNPRVVKSLLAGLGGAAVTGGLTSMSKREEETPSERRKRILKNALLGGVAGAGAYGLGDYAYGQFATADPGPADPVLTPLRNLLTGGGAAAGVLTARGLNMIDERAARARFAQSLVDSLKKQQDPSPARKAILNAAKGIAKSKDMKFSQLFGLDRAFDDMTRMEEFRESLQAATMDPKAKHWANYVAPLKGVKDLKDLRRYVGELAKRGLNRTVGTSGGRARSLGIVGTATALPFAAVEMLNRNPEMARNTFGGLEQGSFEGLIP
jgi:hypothetical protein